MARLAWGEGLGLGFGLMVGRPETLDWVAVGLGLVGGLFALFASIRGLGMKPVDEATKAVQWVAGTRNIIAELDRIVGELREASRVLFFASLAVLAGVGVQVVQLVGRY